MDKEAWTPGLDLYDEQRRKAASRRNYIHYTDIDALNRILYTRSIRLSRLDCVNDLQEAQRVNDELRRYSTFVSCFTYSAAESVPLWLLYGRDKYGVRISFEPKSFVREYYYYYDEEGRERRFGQDEGWEIWDDAMVDVLYTDADPSDVTALLEGESQIDFGKYPGIIKSTAWEYEKETRLRVSIRRRALRDREDRFRLLIHKKPPFESIFARLSDKTFESMKITFNPWMDPLFMGVVRDMVKKSFANLNDNNFSESKLAGKIRKY